jgi:GNAT superfamily N-acetyltransferase
VNETEIDTSLEIRPYVPDDEAEVLRLLVGSLGQGPSGDRSPEFFRWKHLENPFGASFLLVAESAGEIVGLRAFLRWRFVRGDREIRAVRAVDTVTRPDHRGHGIFSKLTLRAIELLRGETDLIFNTPNSSSLPGYLKMGWRQVGWMPIRLRARRPLAIARGLRSIGDVRARPDREITVDAMPARDALEAGEELLPLMTERDPMGRLTTPVSADYLRWRYARAPLGYKAVVDRDAGGVRGVAFFRVRPRGTLWEATVADVLVRPGDVRAAGDVLRRLVRSADIDHAICHFPPHSTQLAGARRRGFLRSPKKGELLTVNPLRDDLADVTDVDAWAVTLGTLEVF